MLVTMNILRKGIMTIMINIKTVVMSLHFHLIVPPLPPLPQAILKVYTFLQINLTIQMVLACAVS